jgi:hypothetical protein
MSAMQSVTRNGVTIAFSTVFASLEDYGHCLQANLEIMSLWPSRYERLLARDAAELTRVHVALGTPSHQQAVF